LDGIGALSRSGIAGTGERALAEHLGLFASRGFAVNWLDRVAHQLLVTAHAFGPFSTIEDARVECPGATDEQLIAARDRLSDSILIDPAAGFVVPLSGLDDFIAPQGVPLVPTIEVLSTDQIAGVCRRLGLDPIEFGTRKAERVAALQGALRDRSIVQNAVRELGDEGFDAFDHLVAVRTPVPMSDLGVPYWYGGGARTYGMRPTVIDELMATGLVGVDSAEQVVWVWLDAIVALRGGMFDHWPAQPDVAPIPIAESVAVLPRALVQLDQLLDLWATEPAPALKSGGIGVKEIRKAAKSIGVTEPTAAVLVHLADVMGLVEPVFVQARSTRSTYSEDYVWRTSNARNEWAALPASDRWTLLVQAWLGAPPIAGGPAAVAYTLDAEAARHAVLGALAEVEPGLGYDEHALRALLAWRHVRPGQPSQVSPVLDELRAIGLVPASGPLGLTALGRAALDGPLAVAALVPDAHDAFVVQADLTVISPPTLQLDIVGELEAIARLESDAGAHVYRLDDVRIAQAVEAGRTADGIIAFLVAHSSVPVAQNVEQFVLDSAKRSGRLRIGTAATYLVSDDPIALAEAIGVKAARLMSVAPNVAVSPLPESKVLTALRNKGIVLSGTPKELPETGRSPYGRPPGSRQLPLLRAVTKVGNDRIRELAGEVKARSWTH
jgi:hypothetical protein